MVNTALAQLICFPLGQYGLCTGNVQKKGLGTINKEKTQEIECFARLEILVRKYKLNTIQCVLSIMQFSKANLLSINVLQEQELQYYR